MGIFDNEVIFSIKFPVESSDDIEKEYDDCEVDLQSFEEFLQRTADKYVYTPRPQSRVKWFLEYAMMVSIDFEIDTEVRKSAYQITVSMDIGYGVFNGPVKKALEKLIVIADDFSLSARKDNPDSLIISIAYYTHERRTKEKT